MEREELFKRMQHSIIEGEKEELIATVKIAIAHGVSPHESIDNGLIKGIEEVGKRFECEEMYLPELIMAANAMKEAMVLLENEIQKRKERRKTVAKALAGTVWGDIHDIGKNIVCSVFTVNGFEVIDLGVNVPPSSFIQKVKELKPNVILLSALLTTTMSGQSNVIEELKRAGIREQVLVLVGGAPVSDKWATQIGADGYAKNAIGAVNIAKELIRNPRRKMAP
jgi:corrinoid protein of di/trimethylamine methyltransferase